MQAGILPIAARLLTGLADRCGHSREAVSEEIDTVSAALGLLINIAEGSQGDAQCLEQFAKDSSGFVPLLCSFIQAMNAPINCHDTSCWQI